VRVARIPCGEGEGRAEEGIHAPFDLPPPYCLAPIIYQTGLRPLRPPGRGDVALHRKGPQRDLFRCLRSIDDSRQSITQEPVGAPIEVAQLAIAARWCWCWCWCYLYLYYLCCTTGHPLQGSARGAGGAREPVKPSARGDICFVCSRWLCLSRGSGLSRGAGPHGKVAKPGPPSQLSGS
jgi:hypothetical protein